MMRTAGSLAGMLESTEALGCMLDESARGVSKVEVNVN